MSYRKKQALSLHNITGVQCYHPYHLVQHHSTNSRSPESDACPHLLKKFQSRGWCYSLVVDCQAHRSPGLHSLIPQKTNNETIQSMWGPNCWIQIYIRSYTRLCLFLFGGLFFFFSGSTGVWTQGLTLAKQALCDLSYSARLLLCWVFLR
jgi:hypothetical protein